MADFSPNPATMVGCNYIDLDGGGFDWASLYLYLGVLFIFYGIIIFLSPFKLLPTSGMKKYLWMGFEAGIKEDQDGRAEYDSFTTGQMHFNGLLFLFKGMLFLWAHGDRGAADTSFTFFTALTIFLGLGFVTFLKVMFVDGGFQKPKAAFWGVAFLVQFVLCLVVLLNNDTDAKQLGKGQSDGLDPAGVLWFIAVFNLFGAVILFLGSFEKFAAKMGAPFYMADDYTYNTFSRTVQRFNALANAGSAVVVLCAAMLASSSAPQDHDFVFPLAFFIDHLFFLVWILLAMIGNPGYWEEFAIVQSTLLMAGGATALLVGWKLDCAN